MMKSRQQNINGLHRHSTAQRTPDQTPDAITSALQDSMSYESQTVELQHPFNLLLINLIAY